MNGELVPQQEADPRTRNAETVIWDRAQERRTAQAIDCRVCHSGNSPARRTVG